MTPNPAASPGPPPKRMRRRILRGCVWGCVSMLALLLVLIAVLVGLLSRVPKSYPVEANPVPPPAPNGLLGGGLDGFDSPYLGHTGSWDGKGGSLGGGSKAADMDIEVAMGLRWTFMPVYWRALEPDGPVDPTKVVPAAWQALDAFVVAAQARKLNILMQAPVVGGNAGGPPAWAGRREAGKSAPQKMDALVAFAGKLAERYRPDGTLARQQGWGNRYGVRAWELDNEPEGYFTCWKGQAGDYAEFVSRAAQRIRAEDPQAVVVAPGMGGGEHGLSWLAETLSGSPTAGSSAFRAAGRGYSIGPAVDAVSFHNYEGLDSAFSDSSRTIVTVCQGVRDVLKQGEQRMPGQTYARKQEYWHTEGNFDFVGVLSAERRAAWRLQFFTRAFAAGIRKVCVMDASQAEQAAVRAYVRVLPRPWPMQLTEKDVQVRRGTVVAFRHLDGAEPREGQVWIVWPAADAGDATVRVPVCQAEVEQIFVTGQASRLRANDGWVQIDLPGDAKMAPGALVVDRPDRSSP